MSLLAFHFDDEIGDGLAGSDENLVRDSGGNMDDVAGFQGTLFATLYGGAAQFAGFGEMAAGHFAASGDDGVAFLDKEDVGLVLVDFGGAGGGAVSHHCVVITVLLKVAAGKAGSAFGKLVF